MCEILAIANPIPIPLNPWIECFAAHSRPGSAHRDGSGIAYATDSGFAVAPRHPSRRRQRLVGRASPPSVARPFAAWPSAQGDARRAVDGQHPTIQAASSVEGNMFSSITGICLEPSIYRSAIGYLAVRPIPNTPSVISFPNWPRCGKTARRGSTSASPSYKQFAERIRPLGPANFFYSDGEILFVHGNRRTVAPGVIAPPGLHVSRPKDDEAANSQLIAIASTPITDPSAWRPLAEGETFAIVDGRIVEDRRDA